MHKNYILSILVLGLSLLVGCGRYSDNGDIGDAGKQPEMTRASATGSYGLYCWNVPENLTAVVRKAAVGEVYYAVPGLTNTPTVIDIISCGSVIEECQNFGVDVWLLAGDPLWGTDPSGLEIKRTVEAVAEYNRRAGVPLAGIHLTVNSYVLSQWASDPVAAANTWYKALKAGKEFAYKCGVRMMVCIPRWLDTLGSGAEARSGINGMDLLEKIIRDCCDEVAVMCCYCGSEVEDLVEEVKIADAYGRRLVCVSDLSEPLGDISVNNTYRKAGLRALLNSWSTVSEAYPNIGFAYHHAAALGIMLDGG